MPPSNGSHSSLPQNGAEVNRMQANGSSAHKTTVVTTASSHSKTGDQSTLGNIMTIRKASKRPLPTDRRDGTYPVVVKHPTLGQDLKSLRWRDVKTLYQLISSKLKGERQVDDKTMIMERIIQIVAGLPNHSKTREALTNDFIDQLWNSLDHPPLLYMGDKFKWRQPDGSFNNPLMPKLGAGGQPYSRTVKPKVASLGAKPDPETIYEAIMARGEFKRNGNNVSSILWYWATIVIHDLFWTNLQDGNINESSSYLDLAPLYGHNEEGLNSIRTFQDGMIKPDAFADKRLIANPPGVCVLLIMFNRFHNHVAANLAKINENNRFPKPAPNLSKEETAAAWKRYDEALFQTARLVTSGLYINIMLIDYVRNIVNLNRVDTQWTLDPRQEMGVSVGTKDGATSGVGNAVSAEFNLCYRWHSCISEMDDLWIQNFYKQLLGDNYGVMDMQTLIMAVKKFEMTVPEDPGERSFSGLQRGADGKFNDDELVDAMCTAIEQPGGAFGARNVPRIMKPVEMLGIIRGRRWNLAGLNEFRKHFGLKAYETFEDINSDPEVAGQLRNLYQHPDYVELYPGIVAEEAKGPMVPGVGITPTYTISRVVLSDAVSLVRGDRYYTTDYHPGNLTHWGFKEVEYDLNVNNGCMFYKLFLRAFPSHFRQNSVYAHFPMVIPSENRKILRSLGWMHRFDFERPHLEVSRVEVESYSSAKHILTNPGKYHLGESQALEFLLGAAGREFPMTGSASSPDVQNCMMRELVYAKGWQGAFKSFYWLITQRLLDEKSYEIAGKMQVDVVRDVGNLAHTHFAARLFNIPLKDKENPKGVFSEQELYMTFALISVCVFHDLDPANLFPLRQAAKEATGQVGRVLETNVKLTKSLGLKGLCTGSYKNDPLSDYGSRLIKELCRSGFSASDITWGQIMPTAAAMVPGQAAMFAQALNWYLSPEGERYRGDVSSVAAQQPSADTDATLLGYVVEGLRMSGARGFCRQAVTSDTIIEGNGEQVTVRPGDRIFVSCQRAMMDGERFPEPESVNPRRPLDSYLFFGAGPESCIGNEINRVALVEMFRAVFRKKGLRRVPGTCGELKKVSQPCGPPVYLTEDWGKTWPFPTSMKVTWDGE